MQRTKSRTGTSAACRSTLLNWRSDSELTTEHQLEAIAAAALLHDMGKLAVPEHILNKPGKLTTAEFEKMKRHADIGADLLSSIKFPYPVVPIVRHHHEFWNGAGYPSGISGTDIPLGARILSVVDCFDALTSDRPYRPRLNDNEAFEILRERRGTMYDPLVVDAFVQAHPEIGPAAIKAGHEARSIMNIAGAAAADQNLHCSISGRTLRRRLFCRNYSDGLPALPIRERLSKSRRSFFGNSRRRRSMRSIDIRLRPTPSIARWP